MLFDGVDVAGATLASLREQIAFVFQETVLFDGTVEENIRLGRPDASDTEVRRAAQIAGADEFVRRLPEGYATPLGRGGRQALGRPEAAPLDRARAGARRARPDPRRADLGARPRDRAALVASLREASRERVVLVVAHRLSTIRAADQILFLADGRMLERGRHEELMARPGGAYRRFVELQTRGAA